MLPSFDWMLNLPPKLALMSIPEWLHEEFLLHVLVLHEKDPTLQLMNYSIKAVANPGEQVTTSIYKVQVIYKGEGGIISKHWFMKTTPCGATDEVQSVDNVFSREILVYTKVLPVIQVLLEEVFLEEGRCFPRYMEFLLSSQLPYRKSLHRLVHHDLESTPYLLFEDLTGIGYTMQREQLDMERTLVIVKGLARFHACSQVVEADNPGLLSSNFQRGSFQMRPDMLMQMKDCFKEFIAALGQWDEEQAEGFVVKMKTLFENFDDQVEKLFDQKKNKLNCLNHGDFHNRNIMYKDKQGSLMDFVVLDYQLCIWGSPAVDLIFARYLILRPGEDSTAMIEFYHQELKGASKELNIDEYTKEDLEWDLKSHKFLGKLKDW